MTGAGDGRLGADAAALDDLATELRAAAARLSSAPSWRSTAPGASALRSWHGPDADSAVALLDDAAAQRRRAAAALDGCASALTRAAVGQRRASRPGPAVAVRVDLAGAGGRLVQRVGVAGASVVVVLVPGVGTDRGDRARLLGDAERVWAAVADRVDDPSSVAVVSWLGYDPPDVVAQGVEVAPAGHGAALLADEVRSLRRGGAARITLVGHSYGGIVAGRAAPGGGADVVVQLGSPGVGVPGGTGAIRAAGAVLVAVRAPGDPIGMVAGRVPGLYGEDPVGTVPTLPTSRTGHGSYLSDPVLLAALAELAVGSPAGG
ncbi:alpha/beta hydrolase [Dermatobacter hominis]|uniref:alpha/beta hydrolase n=1 Tax=Dermatobacter hominis TaxID=2884263 RepID=UPI001D107AF8|nr:alpha/beta hydrolase [Dermatobacter hominis]UDY34750.1 alpha/beta hydrolase family protein [Dermatobacter hominis]